MIGIESEDKTKLYRQPRGKTAQEDHHPWTEDQCKDGAGPGDAQPEPADHHPELLLQNAFFRFGPFVGFRMVDEQPHHIKKTAEPGDDKDNMQRLDVTI